mmetsp:Transcript_82626/g.188843  ORF Transcript_82626/g.188843 Transcript_82626/m.188843 type:complete len:302 (-) Transcript_82626:45-950(-)
MGDPTAQQLEDFGYLVQRCLGRGSTGTVFLCQKDEEQVVAKTVTLASLTPVDQKLAVQEAHVLSQLCHPHVVHHCDSFLLDPVDGEAVSLVIALEHCTGGDLARSIKQAKAAAVAFPEAQVVQWISQTAGALQYIHSHKIIHRDVKSSNVFLTSDGAVKLGDFGLARILENTQDNATTTLGTPYYMSPEICRSLAYGPATDVWSLGVVLHELCALSLPFRGDSLLGIVQSIVTVECEDVSRYGFSDNLAAIARWMLQKDAIQRPSAASLVSMLDWGGSKPAATASDKPRPPPPPGPRRPPA